MSDPTFICASVASMFIVMEWQIAISSHLTDIVNRKDTSSQQSGEQPIKNKIDAIIPAPTLCIGGHQNKRSLNDL